MKHLPSIAAVVLALVALGISLSKGGDQAPAAPAPTNQEDTGRLKAEVDRLKRRVDVLETQVSDLQDRSPPVGGGVPVGVGKVAVRPSHSDVEGTAAVQPVAEAAQDGDAGVPPQLRTLVAQAIQAERDAERARFQEMRARQQAQWVTEMESKLALTLDQKAQLQGVMDWVDARREELGKQMQAGDMTPSQMRENFQANRKAYEERVKGLLTGDQLNKWDAMDERDRRPPFNGPPPPGTWGGGGGGRRAQ